jgi:predicted HTH domain antitoxin
MIQIAIPDDIVQHLRLPPERVEAQLKQELAIHLVRERICTVAQGARLAEMPRLAFEHLLGERQVPWPGTIAEVQCDLETLDSQ